MSSLKEIGDAVVESVKQYVARAIADVSNRIDLLEARVKAIPAGPRGERGDQGERGLPGEAGARGEKGDRGEAGPPGERGERGEPGLAGEKGERGEAGAPAERGAQGERGAPGEPGARGEPGEPGAKGEKGDSGKDGKDGRDGRDGKDGQNGRDGAVGKDALALDILPTIDESRSYPRGTFARHLGGLWRAAGDTQAMRGWECVVAGVAGFDVQQKEDRLFAMSWSLSGGDKVEKVFALPIVLDRGVYQPETAYAKGDGVTWAGSWWIAQVDAPTDKPGISEQWRLAVKRGRDGKDAK